MSPALSLDQVSFAYGNIAVLDQISLGVEREQIVALMGPSGCGKSTLLSIAAGLLTPDRGTVARNFHRAAMMFQDPLLLPWRTVEANVGFALKALGMAKAERLDRARDMLASVGLERDVFERYPSQLSGGMRQRVALARALIVEPDLLLLDEPFSALDQDLARHMLALVKEIVRSGAMSALIVTHSDVEADHIADHVIHLTARPARIHSSTEA